MIATFARGRINYAWFVVAATFVVLLTAAGVRSVPGVLIVPLEHEFGWSRATLSLAVSINLLFYGLFGPFAAAIMERFGIRRVMTAALITIALAVSLTTQMRASWQLLLLWGVMVGLSSGSMAAWVAATVANRWFYARRGLVVGVLTASTATGQLIFLPVLATLTVTAGWRWAVLTVAAVALLIIPLVLLIIRNRPIDIGLGLYGAPVGTAQPPASSGRSSGNPFVTAVATLRSVLGNRNFLLLAGTYYICGATTNGLIGTHLIPASMEHGIPEVTAAGFLAAMGVFALAGTISSGWLSDRFDNRWLLAWYYMLRGLSLLFLPYALGHSYSGLALFIVFYGLDWLVTAPPTARLAADLFGKERVGTIFAWIFTAHQFGAATAALGAGALHTWLGDYQISFMSAGLLALVAAGMAMRVGHPEPGASAPARPLEPEPAAAS